YLVMSIISLVIIVLMVMFDNLQQENSWLYVLLAIAVMWAYLGLMLLYRKMNVHYRLTTQRFIHRVGILTQVSDRIEVIDIDDVTFHQGFIERMVDVGSIKIESSDKSHPELWLLGIENVKIVANQIDDLRRQERHRRGLHIESI
ncbi:MAG TPA: PH domain-containing protein, partial [Planctomycetaceae bacterium]|nr:PH domain-containing protein [Planctomycetaceae bacterium]